MGKHGRNGLQSLLGMYQADLVSDHVIFIPKMCHVPSHVPRDDKTLQQPFVNYDR